MRSTQPAATSAGVLAAELCARRRLRGATAQQQGLRYQTNGSETSGRFGNKSPVVMATQGLHSLSLPVHVHVSD